MALIATNAGNEFPLTPEGQYLGVCYAVIDCGMQYSEMFKNIQRKVQIRWELLDAPKVNIDGEDKPAAYTGFYTLSLKERSTLLKDLQSWKGSSLTPEELLGYDVKALLGKPAVLTIGHKLTDEGRKRLQLLSITKPHKGIEIPKPELEQIYFCFDDHVGKKKEQIAGVIDSLSKGTAEYIRKSETFKDWDSSEIIGGESDDF